MRIVGGALGGRRFGRPQPVTRPTSDRVREAVASILEARGGFEGSAVLELFAGTGAYAFEALSRGAARAVLVESDRRAAAEIQASVGELGLADRVALLRVDLLGKSAEQKLPAGPYDRVFVDPPYAQIEPAMELLGRIVAAGLLAEGALVVLEHRTSDHALVDRALADHAPVDRALGSGTPNSRLTSLSRYRYGDTSISLLQLDQDATAPTPEEEQKERPDA